MTEQEVLEDLAATFADHHKWTFGVEARDSRGKDVDARDPSACRWCAYGRIRKVAGNADIVEAVHERLRKAAGYSIITVNDDLGRKAVIATVQKALAEVQA